MAEDANHVWRKRLSLNSIFSFTSKDVPRDIKLTHPKWQNKMLNFPRLSQVDFIFRTGSSTSGSKELLRTQEKNMSWMKDIIHEFTLSGGLAVDGCAESSSVA